MVDIAEIEKLVALMKASGLMELSVESGDFKISLRRSQHGEIPVLVEPALESAAAEKFQTIKESPSRETTTTFTTPVISPLVGVFHNGGMPDRRSLLREGDLVKEGQVIAAIEAMKVPNELRAPITGVIGRILVEDGAGVEYGQTLFLIEPEEGFA
jgi:acetyl-CoA carboxylase biotin carboxyl carrier protein